MSNQTNIPPPETSLALTLSGRLAQKQRDAHAEIAGAAYVENQQDRRALPGMLHYWQILMRRRGLWLVIMMITTVLGYLATLPQSTVWRAQTSIEVLKENDDFMNLKQATSTTNTGEEDTSEVQSQISLLESKTVLNRAITKLQSTYPHNGNRRQSIVKRLSTLMQRVMGKKPETSDQLFRDELNAVALSVLAKPDPQTRVVQITVDSFDPKLAAAFANMLTAEFIDQNMDSRLGTTAKTSDWLSKQLADVRAELEKSEDTLQNYARTSGLLFTAGDKGTVSEMKLEQIQASLSVALADRAAKESHYDEVQKSSPDALPEVLNDQGLRDLREKFHDLQKQKSDLLTLFTPDYPKVRSIEAQIVSLQTAMDRDRDSILGRIKNEFHAAVRAEETLRKAYADQKAIVSEDGEKSVQYNILKNAVDSNRLIYQTMLQQLKQSTIASALRASTIRLVDSADVPTKPWAPAIPVYCAVGLLAGIFFGAVFIIIREQADRTIQQPGESPIYLALPELGIIPSQHMTVKVRQIASEPSKTHKVELATLQQHNSLVAESFRSTLISILFSTQSGSSPQVLVVSSASPAEGKSTVASNLAIAIAEVGLKILLVDADLRKPRLHEIFHLDNSRGLSSLLHEKQHLNGDGTLDGIVRESSVPGLSILTSGPGTATATNILYGSRMHELVNYFRNQFEVILIDTPPMLQIPDARIVGRIADGVILVVRAGITQRFEALAATQRFAEDGTKVLGSVLNDWDPKTSPDAYYSYRKSYSGYYHADASPDE